MLTDDEGIATGVTLKKRGFNKPLFVFKPVITVLILGARFPLGWSYATGTRAKQRFQRPLACREYRV